MADSSRGTRSNPSLHLPLVAQQAVSSSLTTRIRTQSFNYGGYGDLVSRLSCQAQPSLVPLRNARQALGLAKHVLPLCSGPARREQSELQTAEGRLQLTLIPGFFLHMKLGRSVDAWLRHIKRCRITISPLQKRSWRWESRQDVVPSAKRWFLMAKSCKPCLQKAVKETRTCSCQTTWQGS